MDLLFATTNKNKIKEIKGILSDCDINVLTLNDVGIDIEVEEDGTTFVENAKIKAIAYAREAGMPALADDSGLEVDYLDKAPGVYSSRFLGEDTSYDVKNQYIIERLKGVNGQDRSARFVCAMALAKPDGDAITAIGTIEGIIGESIAGTNGFGYDPIFFLPEYGKTTAELSPEEKNSISHRGNAMREMKEIMKDWL